jgi:hypothetical protein
VRLKSRPATAGIRFRRRGEFGILRLSARPPESAIDPLRV